MCAETPGALIGQLLEVRRRGTETVQRRLKPAQGLLTGSQVVERYGEIRQMLGPPGKLFESLDRFLGERQRLLGPIQFHQ
ncbi:MAG: hypothetical protein AAF368_04495, partial [Planctomycetota bacterium]